MRPVSAFMLGFRLRFAAGEGSQRGVCAPDPCGLFPQVGAGEIIVDGFYKTGRWAHLREVILRRDGYQCQDARRYGRRVPATTVHHVFPREVFPEYQWEAWNLVSLSDAAHERMHNRATHELTDEGVRLLRRVAKKYGVVVPECFRTK